MNRMLFFIFLLPLLAMVIPLYHITFEYSNFLYWSTHENEYKCNCPPNSDCSCPIDTASICTALYQGKNYDSFDKSCTTTRWDGTYWTIQVTAILLSITPALVTYVVLSFFYHKDKNLKQS